MTVLQNIKVTIVRVFIIVLGSLIPTVNGISQTLSLEEVKENLYRQRPQTGDLEIRKLSQNVIDEIASYRYFDMDIISAYWLDMFNKAILEIKNEVVTEGATIWLIYNHGFVVKTPTSCFGFDLFDYFRTGVLLQLVNLLDVQFISHVHPDHWSEELVDKMRNMGKPVVGPSAMSSSILSKRMKPGDTTTISGLHVRSHYGAHSDSVCMFEVRTPEGISFLHTGDNHSYSTLPVNADIDVLMINAWLGWINSVIDPDNLKHGIDIVNPMVALPAHINELGHVASGHTVPHWEQAYELYDFERSFDYSVLSWGERYHFDNTSNDTIPIDDIENIEYQINGNSILVTWDLPLSPADGDTASFYRIILNKSFDRFITERKLSFPWDTIGSSYDITVYAYDDCGNQSSIPAEIKVTVPDLEYPPRIKGSSPGNIDTVEVYSGVSRTFQINATDPNGDSLTYTWKINNTVLPEETSSSFIYNITGLEAGVHKLTATVSDQEYSIQFTWLLNHHNLLAIIDNEDTLMYSDSGSWVSMYNFRYYNGYCRVSSLINKGDWAEFTYLPEIPGNYKVYAYVPSNMPDFSLPVYCLIINDQPVDTFNLDQSLGNEKWTELGNYYLPDIAEVTIRAINTGYAKEGYYVYSDAIKFIYVGESSQISESMSTQAKISVFPNPTNDLLTIETIEPGQHSIKITSLNGQSLFIQTMEGPSHQINLSSFKKGLYFITVRSRDYVSTEKIIKL